MADDELKIPDDDDWLSDLDSDPGLDEPGTGLDQSVFDEMFNEVADSAAAAENGGDEAGAGELDQSDIDALFGGLESGATDAGEGETASVPEGGAEEVSGAVEQAAEPEPEPRSEPDEAAETGAGTGPEADGLQADAAPPVPPASDSMDSGGIDDFFQEDNLPAAEDILDNAFIEDDDGDELDALFGDEDDSVSLGAPDAVPSASGEESAPLGQGSVSEGSGSLGDEPSNPGTVSGQEDEEIEAETVVDGAAAGPGWKAAFSRLAANRKMLAAVSGGLVAIFSLVLFLVIRSPDGEREKKALARTEAREEAAVAVPAPAASPKAAAVEKKPENHPPVAVALQAVLPVDRDRVTIRLEGKDEDNDQLNFEVVSLPSHGVLSGDPPELTYVAGNDFSGSDSFSFRVSDRDAASEPVTVEIRREISSPGGIRVLVPRKPLYRAGPLRLATMSTRRLTIDGRRLWREMNPGLALAPGATLEVRGRTGHGRLQRLSPMVYRYDPDPYGRGTEKLRYRFINDRRRSKTASLVIEVKNGDPPPDVRFAPLSASYYRVGDRVVIDASPTRDDDRGSLKFRWLQKAGVDIRLERLNAEGSKVAFVVPSYFYTVEYPEPVLTVEAKDASGQTGRADIRIPVRRDPWQKEWNGLQPTAYAPVP